MTPKLYEGTKRLHAQPMTRGEYNAYRGWENPAVLSMLGDFQSCC